MDASDDFLSADELLAALVEQGVTHVLGLPDNDTARLFDALEEHPQVRLVRVAREGEAFAAAAGLWLGGAVPFVVVQNTGLLESGDALRGTVSRMGVPLVVLVGYRGFAKMRSAGRDGAPGPLDRDDLVRRELDSVALMTEPTLAAWGVPCERLDGTADGPRVRDAFLRARQQGQPVALLLTRPLA
jgi:hypothetical protein